MEYDENLQQENFPSLSFPLFKIFRYSCREKVANSWAGWLLKILDRDRSRVWNFHYVSGNRRAECKLRIGKRDERVANYGKSLIRYRVGGEFFNSRRLIFPIRAIESIGMKYFHYHRHIRFHRFENRIGKPRPVQE